jgi:hypothetical protein
MSFAINIELLNQRAARADLRNRGTEHSRIHMADLKALRCADGSDWLCCTVAVGRCAVRCAFACVA